MAPSLGTQNGLTLLGRDLIKQVFFKNLAVLGGLLMLMAFGPGGFSFDAKRAKA